MANILLQGVMSAGCILGVMYLGTEDLITVGEQLIATILVLIWSKQSV